MLLKGPGLLDAVINVIIHPIIHHIDLLRQILWKKYHIFVFLWQEVIELRVKHPDDLTTLIVHDRLGLLVV